MKIAILGGGITGVTAAYYLLKKGYSVTLFEKETMLGGLASGFKMPGWNWFLDRAYHHIFDIDRDILDFSDEIGCNEFFFQKPETSSLYKVINPSTTLRTIDYRIIPVDTPQDFLKFPLLSFPIKIRSAMVLAFLKFFPHLSIYDRQTSKEFLQKTMGNEAWNILWEELFRKKFGKYAGNILASFIWARINKRTKSLGYAKGGFQEYVNNIESKLSEGGVEVVKGVEVEKITKDHSKFQISLRQSSVQANFKFDSVISTLPTPIIAKLGSDILPADYSARLNKLKYLYAVNLILETDKPILEKTYWLSICVKEFPFMVLVQHTNFIDKQYYGGKHITYIAKYVEVNDPLMKMDKEKILSHWLPYLKISNSTPAKLSTSKFQISNSYLFKAAFAQPIFDKEFLKNKPDFKTPVENFYIANLDMTYPYDRGTNYAVKLGKEVSKLIR